MKNKLVIASLLSIVVLLGACGKKLGDVEVEIGGKVIEKDDKIVVEGESNLLPGSRVTGKVLVDDGEEVFTDTTEVVSDKGKFQMEMDHHKYGDAEVVITFDFSSLQDEEIIEHYGEHGEKLEGPYVYLDEHWNEVKKRAEVRVQLTQDADTDTHELTALEWEEKPEDYGDPRVWIEVDEITDDKEFFYIKGRSNLHEGSYITGKYSRTSKRDSTRVNPDGTFDLKMGYEYSEEPYFTFEFNPGTGQQWRLIRDTYGDNGEKLVGKHVETSGSTQFIQVEVDYQHDD